MDDGGVITVEFFGPFRSFGKVVEVPAAGPVSFGQLVEALVERFGESFGQRARMRNTTFIVNSRVIRTRDIESTEVDPGDRVAFALLIGGG